MLPVDVGVPGVAAEAEAESAVEIEIEALLTPAAWGAFAGLDLLAFWTKVFDVEDAERLGTATAVLATNGLATLRQFERVKEAYVGQHPDFGALTEARNEVRAARHLVQLKAADAAHLLEPIHGVDLKTYASMMALKTAGDQRPTSDGRVFASFGVDRPTFDLVAEGWLKRLNATANPLAVTALLAEYGRHFAAAIPRADGGEEPCTFARYVEVQAAYAIWLEQGTDPATRLRGVFGLSRLDWSNIQAFWQPKLLANPELQRQLGVLDPAYRSRYGVLAE